MSILSLLYTLKDIGFENTDIEEFFEYMKQQDVNESVVSYNNHYSIDSDNKYIDEFKSMLNILREMGYTASANATEVSVNAVFDTKLGWGEHFYNFCFSNKDMFWKKRAFFKFVDVEKCIEAINVGSVADINDFRDGLNSYIYSFSNIKEYYIEDKSHIEKLYDDLKTEDESVMRQYHKGLLKKYLESVLYKLN